MITIASFSHPANMWQGSIFSWSFIEHAVMEYLVLERVLVMRLSKHFLKTARGRCVDS